MSFHLTTASVLGREHARLLRNNQDGMAARVEGPTAVAVVTDGCGSGASSEVGARLGARFLAQGMSGWVREVGLGPQLAERATDALLGWVYAVVRPLDVDGASMAGLVGEQWLFTFLCAVMDEKAALIFGIGDGVWRADADARVLEAGEANAPDYLAYRLVSRAQVRAESGCRWFTSADRRRSWRLRPMVWPGVPPPAWRSWARTPGFGRTRSLCSEGSTCWRPMTTRRSRC
jgi:hypothetical protein